MSWTAAARSNGDSLTIVIATQDASRGDRLQPNQSYGAPHKGKETMHKGQRESGRQDALAFLHKSPDCNSSSNAGALEQGAKGWQCWLDLQVTLPDEQPGRGLSPPQHRRPHGLAAQTACARGEGRRGRASSLLSCPDSARALLHALLLLSMGQVKGGQDKGAREKAGLWCLAQALFI